MSGSGAALVAALLTLLAPHAGAQPDVCPRPNTQPLDLEATRKIFGPGLVAPQTLAPAFDVAAVVKAFPAPKYRCTVFNRTTGMSCRGKVGRYPGDVTFFIPPDYRPTDKTDLVLHLHGLYQPRANLGRKDTYDDMLKEFSFAESLARSGRNSILIVPDGGPGGKENKNKFDSEFGNEAGLRRFMDAASGLVQKAGLSRSAEPGALALTAHSRGGAAVAEILRIQCVPKQTCYRGAIKDVSLFDAAYDVTDGTHKNVDTFAEFAAEKNPPTRFRSVYYHDADPNRQGTLNGNLAIWRKLHPELPANLTDDELQTRFKAATLGSDTPATAIPADGPVFINSDQEHYPLLNKYLDTVLQR